jgi:hypothetical protein
MFAQTSDSRQVELERRRVAGLFVIIIIDFVISLADCRQFHNSE